MKINIITDFVLHRKEVAFMSCSSLYVDTQKCLVTAYLVNILANHCSLAVLLVRICDYSVSKLTG